jgi:hypothetical protein
LNAEPNRFRGSRVEPILFFSARSDMTRLVPKSLFVLLVATSSAFAADPLPSWNDTAPKAAIIAFVEKVTREGSADFVPPAERIAVFDNDGTLWPETPVPFQAAFLFDELKRRAPKEPKLAADPMVKAALAGDVAKLMAGEHHDGLMRVIALTHAGMTATTSTLGLKHGSPRAKTHASASLTIN